MKWKIQKFYWNFHTFPNTYSFFQRILWKIWYWNTIFNPLKAIYIKCTIHLQTEETFCRHVRFAYNNTVIHIQKGLKFRYIFWARFFFHKATMGFFLLLPSKIENIYNWMTKYCFFFSSYPFIYFMYYWTPNSMLRLFLGYKRVFGRDICAQGNICYTSFWHFLFRNHSSFMGPGVFNSDQWQFMIFKYCLGCQFNSCILCISAKVYPYRELTIALLIGRYTYK